MIKVYLAGYSGETEYRKYACKIYGKQLFLFDPMKKIDLPTISKKELYELTNDEVSFIVEGDKAAIESCDLLVAFIKRASFGTSMEMIHAYKNKIPIYVIDPTTTWRNDIWIRYHTNKFFDDIDSCFHYIINSIKGL